MKTCITLVAASVLCSALAVAQEPMWRLGLGVHYRSISEDLDIDAMQLSNPAYGGDYVNGQVEPDDDSDRWTVIVHDNRDLDADGGQNDASINGVHLDRVTAAETQTDLDHGMGIALSAGRDLMRGDRFGLGIELTFQTSSTDFDGSSSVSTVSDVWYKDPAFGDLDPPTSGSWPHTDMREPLETELGNGTTTTSSTIAYDMDLDMYTIGLGVNGFVSTLEDRCQLLAGLGPALAIVDVDFAATENVTNSTDGSAVYTAERSDNGTEVLFGAYACLGLQFYFSDTVGVSFEYRYDLLFEDLDLDYVSGDLSGSSATMKLSVRF